MTHVLVPGGSGFIGSHLVNQLLAAGYRVTVVDNFDPFYDAAVKRQNIANHRNHPGYTLVEADIRDLDTLQKKLKDKYDIIVHLAAKAGVRPSIDNPIAYQEEPSCSITNPTPPSSKACNILQPGSKTTNIFLDYLDQNCYNMN